MGKRPDGGIPSIRPLNLYLINLIKSENQPRPLATELASISTRKMGATHLIMTLNNFSALNLPSVSFTSSDIVFVDG
ncbi:MAG: hypothetical protein ACLTT1_18650 [[Clostridium] scindens]